MRCKASGVPVILSTFPGDAMAEGGREWMQDVGWLVEVGPNWLFGAEDSGVLAKGAAALRG
jgi:hypothetical protein